MIVFLLIAAGVILLGAILIVLWQYADRRVQRQLTEGEAKMLQDRLSKADEEREDMLRRIEQLEAIAADRPLHGGL